MIKPNNTKTLSVLVLTFLMACGSGGGGNTNTLSGTVIAPTGGNIKDTVVRACWVENDSCIISSINTKTTTITSSGNSGSFSFPSMPTGSYIIAAIKDTNGSNNLDNGDYNGCYGNGTTCSIVNPPKTDISIQMTVMLTGSLSGNLIFGGGNGASVPTTSIATGIGSVGQASLRIDTTAHNNLNANRGEEVVPGEVLVRFKPGIRTQSMTSLSVGGTAFNKVRALAASTELFLYRSNALGQTETKNLVAAWNKRNDVAEAFPNRIMRTYKTPNDSIYGAQWHYPMFNLPNAWDIQDGVSPTVVVGVVDTGITAHPDLVDTTIAGYDFVSDPTSGNDGDGWDNDPTDTGDSQGSGFHGSHVAGTIAAKTNNSLGVAGISWGAKILPVRVLGADGSGTSADIIEGVLWAAGEPVAGVPTNPNPAKVINMSLGGKGACSDTEKAVFKKLADKGVLVAVAVGNDNEDATLHHPSNCGNVIRVGAVGPQKTRAPYSNYGPLDVMAPGGDTSQKFDYNGKSYSAGVLSTIKNDAGEYIYGFYQGTSMATPHIAGLLALMAAKDPSINYATALAKLKAAATPMTATECNTPSGSDCGAGFVDAAKALNSNATPTPTPTPPPPPPPTPPAPPPPPTSDANTYVAAFYCSNYDSCTPYDENRSDLIKIQGGGIKIPFKISGLEAGPYTVAAWQDLNGNVIVDDGEPFGVSLTSTGKLLIVDLKAGQNLAGYSINMVPIAAASFTDQNVVKQQMQRAVSQTKLTLSRLRMNIFNK